MVMVLNRRDFTYISDCIEAISSSCTIENLIGQTINIGGKERATVNEIILLSNN